MFIMVRYIYVHVFVIRYVYIHVCVVRCVYMHVCVVRHVHVYVCGQACICSCVCDWMSICSCVLAHGGYMLVSKVFLCCVHLIFLRQNLSHKLRDLARAAD